METAMGKDIVEAMEKIGTAIKPFAEQGWEILLRQSYICGYQLLSGCALGLIVVCCTYFLSKKINDSFDQAMFRVIAYLIGTGAICICGINAIGYFLNPEYYALKDILGK